MQKNVYIWLEIKHQAWWTDPFHNLMSYLCWLSARFKKSWLSYNIENLHAPSLHVSSYSALISIEIFSWTLTKINILLSSLQWLTQKCHPAHPKSQLKCDLLSNEPGSFTPVGNPVISWMINLGLRIDVFVVLCDIGYKEVKARKMLVQLIFLFQFSPKTQNFIFLWIAH